MEILPNHIDYRPYRALLKINLLLCFVKFRESRVRAHRLHADARRAQTRARGVIHVTSWSYVSLAEGPRRVTVITMRRI